MKRNIAVIGLQNGDEGKGKIVGYLVREMFKGIPLNEKLLVYRYQGGGNAGHTVVIGDQEYALHQLPSGLVIPDVYGLLGTGMFVNPKKLVEEIEGLSKRGLIINRRKLGISSKAHMTLDYHVTDDQSNFDLAEHTSTGNGIKQTARDKMDRVGIRFIEFLDSDLMAKILQEKTFPGGFPGDCEKFVRSYDPVRQKLAPFLVLEQEIFSQFNYAIAEGAQGVMLDVDEGQYPGITSSNPSHPNHRCDHIVGILKMYTSSVGIGDRPFVSEMDPELQDALRDAWGEYGTTTNRKRHIGWFDAVAAKYAMQCTHVDSLAGTNLDKLEKVAELGQKLYVCTAYEIDDKRFDKWEVSFDRRDTLTKAKPILEELEPWDQTMESDGKTLTPAAEKYKSCLEDLLGMEFSLMGNGPEQKQILVYKNIF